MDRFPNVMILRTMSKWAGLAGMRVGYGLVPTELVGAFSHVVPPFHNVALASSEAAIAAIEDRDFLIGSVAAICDYRDALVSDTPADQRSRAAAVRDELHPGPPLSSRMHDRSSKQSPSAVS